ncbi:nuclear protein MDM1 [Paragonimus westermani]|uniref:Nuclear protein MDM1 n=1 Tax=Paragonimus westermani TaxID=34504 RepID=A0A5J4NXE6_9TREM|nr:nuclear protein MDM1 [Paragonimus westermani]
MVHLREEPLFQAKRRVGPRSDFNLRQYYTNPKQDDYFVIGSVDKKFAPSIAYRNRLKYQSRSASPVRPVQREPNHQCQEHQKVALVNQTYEQQNHVPTRVVRPSSQLGRRRDESVQTDGPRKALEDEIRRIRTDIERRKRTLKHSSQSKEHMNDPCLKNNFKSTKTDPKPKLRLKMGSDEREHSEAPQAPRLTEQKGTTALRVYAGNAQQFSQPRSYSPQPQTRLSEYQRAYKTPELFYPVRNVRSAQPYIRKKTYKYSTPSYAYETEYRHEYKPFRYVPENQLKTTNIGKELTTHIVPIPRPRSAYSLHDVAGEQKATSETRRWRSLTPQPATNSSTKRRRKRYITEYADQYRSYFDHGQSGLPDSNHPMHWLDQLDVVRRSAEANYQRMRGSHFTPDHFAQLDSDWVDFWDPPSSDRYAERNEKSRALLSNPPAGKPSLVWTDEPTDCNGHSPTLTASMRRSAMFNSQNVAEALVCDELWSSNSNCDLNQARLRKPVSVKDFYPKRIPVKQLPTRSGFPLKTYSDASFETSAEKDNDSGPGNFRATEEKRCSVCRQPVYRRLNHSTVVETDSISSLSPLSARSMISSASVASETLARAKKQHKRMFREYDDQTKQMYSPHSYTQSLSQTNSPSRTFN